MLPTFLIGYSSITYSGLRVTVYPFSYVPERELEEDKQASEHEQPFNNSSHTRTVGSPLRPEGPGTCLAASASI